MTSSATSSTSGDALAAEAEYASRRRHLTTRQAAAERREMLLGRVKLVLGALVLLLAVFVISHPGLVLYVVAAIVLFVVLAIVHERLLRAIALRGRQIRFYAQGLARLDGTWRTVTPTPAKRGRETAPAETGGEAFRTPDHPYAADLDLFGPGSLFHLLSTARTHAGERTLADWLLAPAAPETVVERQAAVQELAPLLDLRERLATVGEDIRASVHAATLTEWAEASSEWPGAAALRIVAFILGGIWVAAIAYWAVAGSAVPLIASTAVNIVLRGLLAGRIRDSLAGLDRASQELAVLSSLLALIERESFHAPLLTRLQAALKTDGIAPSAAIARLSRIVNRLEDRLNMIFQPFDLGLLWTLHFTLFANNWRSHFGPSVRQWLATMGEFEALVSLASHSFEHPEDIFPQFAFQSASEVGLGGRTRLVIESFAHPLLDRSIAIRNDLTLSSYDTDNLQLVVISGPNMAGKSTFLRGLGVNVVLAQAGAPVRARSMSLTPLAVAASISVSDSLASGISRFYAEIRRVKLVSDLADGRLPVLFLLDELLSGTNSHDRFIGTQFVVRSLLERGAIGIVTTHDLALTVIPESLATPMRGINSHFEDRIEHDPIEGDRLSFDYRLTPGIVQTSNALTLMRSIGLKVDG